MNVTVQYVLLKISAAVDLDLDLHSAFADPQLGKKRAMGNAASMSTRVLKRAGVRS